MRLQGQEALALQAACASITPIRTPSIIPFQRTPPVLTPPLTVYVRGLGSRYLHRILNGCHLPASMSPIIFLLYYRAGFYQSSLIHSLIHVQKAFVEHLLSAWYCVRCCPDICVVGNKLGVAPPITGLVCHGQHHTGKGGLMMPGGEALMGDVQDPVGPGLGWDTRANQQGLGTPTLDQWAH